MFGSARLSPDGKQIAVRATGDDGIVRVLVLDAATFALKTNVQIGKDDELQWFRWAGNGRLLLSVSSVTKLYGEEVPFTRLHSFDFATSGFTVLDNKSGGLIGDDLLFVDPDGRFALVAQQRSIWDWPAVWRFSLEPGHEKDAAVVQKAKDGIWDWYADDAGAVRIGLEFTGRKMKLWYRSTAEDKLKVAVKLGRDDFEEKVWDVARIVSGSDEGYVIEEVDGKAVLRKFNYATRTGGDIVYRNPDWDVTDATIGDDGQPVAAYYTDDKQRIVWFDEKMKAVQAKLEKALPDQDITVISRARDDSSMLVFAGREDDPGALYFLDNADRTMKFVANYRPGIDHTLLARPQPVTYAARDKTAIHAYLTLPRGREPKGLPLVILPHGGPYGVRDTLGYDDEVQLIANRGYAVLQPNFRGSGGYGQAFEDLGSGQIGRGMQDDLDDAMDWAVGQGIADPKRVCVVGSSYGGYAALWAVIRNPERYRCAASFAGVTDYKKQLRYSGRSLDSDDRKDYRHDVIGEDGSFDLDSISPARQVARLTRPVLLAHGDKDSRVPYSQFTAMRDAAERSNIPLELLTLPGEGHGFEKAESEQKWYDYLESFLLRNNPPD